MAKLSDFNTSFNNMQVFTSPGTFTVPSGTSKVKVTATGGGGGHYNDNIISVGSGGGGGTGIAIINLSGTTSVPVTVGSLGSPSSGGPFPAFPGGDSLFGTYVTGGGGGGGSSQGVGIGSTASFPAPAPSYQGTLSLPGAPGNTYSVNIPGVGRILFLSSIGKSFLGSYGNGTYAYGAGNPAAGASIVPGSSGIVIVEW